MKAFLVAVIIAISINVYPVDTQIVSKSNEYSGRTELSVYDSNESKKLKKRTVYYDKSNSVKKVDMELSEASVKAHGVIRQIEYYDNGAIVKYEMFHSKDFIDETGIDKTVEYMGKNDTVIKTDYFRNDTMIFSESMKSYSVKFELGLIGKYDRFIRDEFDRMKNDVPKGDHIALEAKTFKCKTVVKYLNQQADIDEYDKTVLDGYLKMRGNNEMPKLYSKKILVSENDNKYWVLIQDKVLKYIKKDQKMLLMYYYIGGYNDQVVIMGIDFIDL